jgi:hypothetical protein
MKRSAYVETTIISYLAGRPSRDLVTAAHQELTSEWWTRRRRAFRIFVSPAVLDECSRGDREAVRRRMEALRGTAVLEVTPDAMTLARVLVRERAVPTQAAADAMHIALAAVHRMDFLLTWNCRHIANAEVRGQVEDVLRSHGFVPPVLCTPEELMGS